MAEAAGHDRWARVSSLMALIANVNRDPKRTRPFSPDDFSPFAVRRTATPTGMPITKSNLHVLKQLCETNGPRE